MGFLIGASCFVPSVPLHSRFLPSSSSNSPSQFGFLCSSNVAKFKSRRPTSASLNGEDDDAVKRRAFVLVGISVLPFLQFQSPALAAERGNEIKTSKVDQETEAVAVVSEATSPNTFLSLLNGLGIFSAGVLGALYPLARQDTKATRT